MIIPVTISKGGNAFGYIIASFPAGTVSCTCSSGGTVLQADAAGLARGQFVFEVPAAGEWTVTISNGTDTKSESVSITAAGQAAAVELSFSLFILRDGSYGDYGFKGYPGRAVSFSDGEIKTTSSGSSTSPFCFETAIDLTAWSTLVFKVQNTSLSSAYPFAFGVKTTANMVTAYAYRAFAAETVLTETSLDYREISVDISALSGDFYIHGIGVGPTNTSEIWLE